MWDSFRTKKEALGAIFPIAYFRHRQRLAGAKFGPGRGLVELTCESFRETTTEIHQQHPAKSNQDKQAGRSAMRRPSRVYRPRRHQTARLTQPARYHIQPTPNLGAAAPEKT